MTTSIESAVKVERLAAEERWRVLLPVLELSARLEGWQQSSSPQGPLLSARVTGRDAVEALIQFAAAERAVLDYGVPGRVSCVWRSNGLWLELWHPDSADEPGTAVAGPSGAAVRRALLRRPNGRLPFTRRRKETNRA